MIETLIGTLFGGLFRLAPEVLKWMDAKNDRAHELAMFDKQLEADRLRATSDIDKINAQSSAAMGVEEIRAIIEGDQGAGNADRYQVR